jgi:hypothetical protein
MDVPFPFMHEDTVTKGLAPTCGRAGEAVRDGYADPDRIVFGAATASGAARGALATRTTPARSVNIWPDPEVAGSTRPCGFERPADAPDQLLRSAATEVRAVIDPSIPQTIIVARRRAVVNFDSKTRAGQRRASTRRCRPIYAQLIVIPKRYDRSATGAALDLHGAQRRAAGRHDLWGTSRSSRALMQYQLPSSFEGMGHRLHAVGGRLRQGPATSSCTRCSSAILTRPGPSEPNIVDLDAGNNETK